MSFIRRLACTSEIIISMMKEDGFHNHHVINMAYCLFDSGEDGEHNSISLLQISNIFATQDFFDEALPFDRVYDDIGGIIRRDPSRNLHV